MMTILNQLRADRPGIANFTPGAMTPLATPATQDAAVSLFFREKVFRTFGRGQRLGDLRRLIRQYGRTQDKVFPSGVYDKGGVYGQDVNFRSLMGKRSIRSSTAVSIATRRVR